jgi:hypothetical protein
LNLDIDLGVEPYFDLGSDFDLGLGIDLGLDFGLGLDSLVA